MKLIKISNNIAEWITYDGKYIKAPLGHDVDGTQR